MPKIVRMNLLRRYPITCTLLALVLVSALAPLPPLVDAVSGAPPYDVDLVRPATYTVLAPLSDVLDALTFLSLGRAWWFLLTWIVALSVWGLLRAGPPRRRVLRATLGPLGVVVLGLAAVLVPRPVLRLVPADSTLTVIDYHAHTAASHDGRPGWTARDLARWHAAQGFGASYVTDHNVIFDDDTTSYAIPLLPGVEWSVSEQHVVALGPVTMIDRAAYNGDTPGALGFPAPARARVLELAGEHDLLVVGASDNHGWGRATCVWNVSSPSAHGFRSNRILARPIALAQADWQPWTAAYTQPWLMLRGLSWSERSSWLTWLLVILIYRAVPRRQGDPGGIGILARSLSLKILKLHRPPPG